MALGVPPNATHMYDVTNVSPSVLRLSVSAPPHDGHPDWPDLVIEVDGARVFSGVKDDWRGFDPEAMLGAVPALLPTDPPRRLALLRCVCGEPGCGSIAPVVSASADGRHISWTDPRRFVGVFVDPIAPEIPDRSGQPVDAAAIHFDRAQYVAEVRRAAADRTWETPRRRTSRLLRERLPEDLRLSGLPLRWVAPEWSGDGTVIGFERPWSETESGPGQLMLRLTSPYDDPSAAADDLAALLLATPPDDWTTRFGYQPG